MPKRVLPLTDIQVQKAKTEGKSRKLVDGQGLYLLLTPSGGKLWRFNYRFNGRQKTLALGVYPAVTLAKARQRRELAKGLISEGIDPGAAKKVEKEAKERSAVNTFEPLAREWFKRVSSQWVPSYSKQVMTRLENDIFPVIGSKPVAEITPQDVRVTIQRVEARGVSETARRLLQVCGQIFRYGVMNDRLQSDPSRDLRGLVAPVRQKHHASLTDPRAIGGLLRAIENYEGNFLTKYALKLSALTFVRPGELRKAEWSEIHWDSAEWRIPAERMKMRSPHIVPLSRQAMDVFREIRPLAAGTEKFIFPSERTRMRPMSENTVTAALRRMGYSNNEMTAHGFRSMASTLLNEMGWRHDAIERQLAHAERNNVRAAYNYAEYLPERRAMMQAWADYLGELRDRNS